MKIYNYSSYTVEIDGEAMEGQVSEVPDTYQGDLTINGTTLSWDDDPYQYIMIYEDGNGLQIEHPIVHPPPFVTFFWLFVCVFMVTFFVKILQKIKGA